MTTTHLCVGLLLTISGPVLMSSIPTGIHYGCYGDDWTSRDLPVKVGNISDSNMPESCIIKCREQGQKFAGVEWGNECYCGQAFGRYGKSDHCNKTCGAATGAGQPSADRTCGGYLANDIYGTGIEIETLDSLAESVHRLEQAHVELTERLAHTEAQLNASRETQAGLATTLNDTVRRLDTTQAKLAQFTSAIFRASSVYNSHTYLLSTPFPAGFHTFTLWCRVQDGYMLEINDRKEFDHVLKLLADNPSSSNPVVIGMTNKGHLDTWVYPTSGNNVTFTKWAHGRPANIGTSNCVMLSNFSHDMFDFGCESEIMSRFICEVPS